VLRIPCCEGLIRMASSGTVPFKETGVDLTLVVGQELGMGAPRPESYLGLAHLTYRGLVRQIRGMLRVALPSNQNGSRKRRVVPTATPYRYWNAPGMRMFLEEFEGHLRQIRGVTVRVDA
jgi:hypothetical protein